MELAVIRAGGKQYVVSPGKKIKIEKVGSEKGAEICFEEVLLAGKGKKLAIGTPLVEGAKAFGKVVGRGKGRKVIVFKYGPKTRRRRKKGHRQPFTEVEITKIAF